MFYTIYLNILYVEAKLKFILDYKEIKFSNPSSFISQLKQRVNTFR